jgi:TonB family protein
MKMINRISKLAFSLLFLGIATIAYSQKREITPLNCHFNPISEKDTLNLAYHAMVTHLEGNIAMMQVVDLENRIVQITKEGYNAEGSFPEEIIETFDRNGKLKSKKTKNKTNGMFHAAYYNDEVFLGEVIYKPSEGYEITKAGQSPTPLMEQNEFEPTPNFDKAKWYKLLANNLRYPQKALDLRETGTVILALLINENSEVVKIEVANPEEISKSLAKEAIRVVSVYNGKFVAAKDFNGDSVEAWVYIPVRFKLS